jgi:AcrR family transcriptional regulator
MVMTMGKLPNTKSRILNTALNLFSKHGYSGTSIRNIAKEVGVRESAIYNHFSSKTEILKAILEDFKTTAPGKDVLNEKLIDKLDNPRIFLKDFAMDLIKEWTTEREKKFMRLILMEQFRETEGIKISMADYFSDLKTILKMIFDQMIRHGFIRKHNSELLADEYIAILYYLRIEHITADKKQSLKKIDELVNKHIEFFWEAVKP